MGVDGGLLFVDGFVLEILENRPQVNRTVIQALERVVVCDGAVSRLYDHQDPVSVGDVYREEQAAMGEYVHTLGPSSDLNVPVAVSLVEEFGNEKAVEEMRGGCTCGLAPGITLLKEGHVGVDYLII